MEIPFKFDELGLLLDDGFECGKFSGLATIDCDHGRPWKITGLKVDGCKLVDGEWIWRLDARGFAPPSHIARWLLTALRTQPRWSRQIKAEVAKALAEDDAVEDRAFKQAYEREML